MPVSWSPKAFSYALKNFWVGRRRIFTKKLNTPLRLRVDPTLTQPGADRKAKAQRLDARKSGRWRKQQARRPGSVQLSVLRQSHLFLTYLTHQRLRYRTWCIGFTMWVSHGRLGMLCTVFNTSFSYSILDSLSHSLILVTLVLMIFLPGGGEVSC